MNRKLRGMIDGIGQYIFLGDHVAYVPGATRSQMQRRLIVGFDRENRDPFGQPDPLVQLNGQNRPMTKPYRLVKCYDQLTHV